MADNVVPFHPAKDKKPLTAAERGRAFRVRKRQEAGKAEAVKAAPAPAKAIFTTPPAPPAPVRPVRPVRERAPNAPRTFANDRIAPFVIRLAAFGLAGVGVTMNGWFARSLGSSDVSGWMFLGLGVAADLTALAAPSCAASLWHARQRGAAIAAWAIWAVAFAFAIQAGIGFTSVNISDVTFARSQRSSPAITNANAALADATTARDRECANGVGKFCREREAAVADRRQALDAAMRGVAGQADPQTSAAIKVVSWLSLGSLQPTGDDFGMLRLILLALLPQLGGVLLMIGKARPTSSQPSALPHQ